MRLTTISLALAFLPSLAFAQFESAEIPYATSAPVIDGVADEAVWALSEDQSDFETVGGQIDGPDDSFTIWKALWDEENFYAHVSVIDDTIVSGETNEWNDDSIEFYFDATLLGLQADALGEEMLDYGPGAGPNPDPIFQLTILTEDTELHEGVNHLKYVELNGDSAELNAGWVIDASFYALEIAFPWSALGTDVAEVLGQDGTIGFGMAINDDDDGDARDGQTMWASSSPGLWNDATEFPFVKLLPPPDNNNDVCDFDADTDCDVDDINALQGALGTDNATYDLDGNGTVDSADTDEWLSVAGNKEVGVPFRRGDADLNGVVDAGDLNSLGTNWQSENSPQWQDGNFNGDLVVNAQDLNEIGQNWQFGVAAPLASTVPEPSGLYLLGLGLLAVVRLRRRIA